jgi:hypothetical protein
MSLNLYFKGKYSYKAVKFVVKYIVMIIIPIIATLLFLVFFDFQKFEAIITLFK